MRGSCHVTVFTARESRKFPERPAGRGCRGKLELLVQRATLLAGWNPHVFPKDNTVAAFDKQACIMSSAIKTVQSVVRFWRRFWRVLHQSVVLSWVGTPKTSCSKMTSARPKTEAVTELLRKIVCHPERCAFEYPGIGNPSLDLFIHVGDIRLISKLSWRI